MCGTPESCRDREHTQAAYVVSEERKAAQAAVDGALVGIEGDLKMYLRAKFSLSKVRCCRLPALHYTALSSDAGSLAYRCACVSVLALCHPNSSFVCFS